MIHLYIWIENIISGFIIKNNKAEDKNLIRQNFIAADVGKNKAEVLATRYGGQFNESMARCTYVDKYLNNERFRKVDAKIESHFIDTSQLHSIMGVRKSVLYINLIDNATSRKIVHLTAMDNSESVVLDVANNEYNGQLTASLYSRATGHIDDKSGWFYNSVGEQLSLNDDVSVFSCADADAESSDQLFNANDMAATVLGNYVNSWLVDGKLSYGRVDFVTGSRMSIKSSIPYLHAYLGTIGNADLPDSISSDAGRGVILEIMDKAGVSIEDINEPSQCVSAWKREYSQIIQGSL